MATLATQRTHSSPANRMDPEGRRTAFDKVYLGFMKEYADTMFRNRVYAGEAAEQNNNHLSLAISYRIKLTCP